MMQDVTWGSMPTRFLAILSCYESEPESPEERLVQMFGPLATEAAIPKLWERLHDFIAVCRGARLKRLATAMRDFGVGDRHERALPDELYLRDVQPSQALYDLVAALLEAAAGVSVPRGSILALLDSLAGPTWMTNDHALEALVADDCGFNGDFAALVRRDNTQWASFASRVSRKVHTLLPGEDLLIAPADELMHSFSNDPPLCRARGVRVIRISQDLVEAYLPSSDELPPDFQYAPAMQGALADADFEYTEFDNSFLAVEWSRELDDFVAKVVTVLRDVFLIHSASELALLHGQVGSDEADLEDMPYPSECVRVTSQEMLGELLRVHLCRYGEVRQMSDMGYAVQLPDLVMMADVPDARQIRFGLNVGTMPPAPGRASKMLLAQAECYRGRFVLDHGGGVWIRASEHCSWYSVQDVDLLIDDLMTDARNVMRFLKHVT